MSDRMLRLGSAVLRLGDLRRDLDRIADEIAACAEELIVPGTRCSCGAPAVAFGFVAGELAICCAACAR